MTIPSDVARLFLTSSSSATIATSGMRLPPTSSGSNEYRSATKPVTYVAMIVPMPAAVPLIPLTDATEFLG